VSALNLTCDCGFGARVILHFDARPDFEPDGSWTHGASAELERRDWEKAYTTLQENKLQFILTDGSSRTLQAATDDETYITIFGQMLVDLLKAARDAGERPSSPAAESAATEERGSEAVGGRVQRLVRQLVGDF